MTENELARPVTGALPPVSRPPEAHAAFRRGQLLVLLEEVGDAIAVDRLGYVEFFAANPFLIWRQPSSERTRLQLAGLLPTALSYQAAPERYANRRSRLRTDLAGLTAWGFVSVDTVDQRVACRLTPQGAEVVARLNSVYGEAYRLAVSLVLPKLRNVSNLQLNKLALQWLDIADLRIDLLDSEYGIDIDGQGRLL